MIGNDEFTIGFRLAGIKKIITVANNTVANNSNNNNNNNNNNKYKHTELLTALGDKSIGVLVLERDYILTLPERIREKVEDSIQPVCVVLSQDRSGEDDLRRKVKKSIGLDVWDK